MWDDVFTLGATPHVHLHASASDWLISNLFSIGHLTRKPGHLLYLARTFATSSPQYIF